MERRAGKHQVWRRTVSILCALALLFAAAPTAFAGTTLEEHIVGDTVDPAGISLNLFDYWVTPGRYDEDNKTPYDTYGEAGINTGHALKFTSTGVRDRCFNRWTGKNGGVFPGIVQKKLAGGYPVLTEGLTIDGTDTNLTTAESLNYLFDPNIESPGKASYTGVTGLLRIDEDGYYYYNADSLQKGSSYADANYAVFDEETNSFRLYDTWGVKASGEVDTGVRQARGQFFPFSDPEKKDIFNTDGSSLTQTELLSKSGELNHYFGMTMTTRFIQRYEGKVDTAQDAQHMTYEFAGDDDIWIFIDGVLVADLGGMHNIATTKIDFYTGEVTVNGRSMGTLKDIMGTEYTDDSYWSDDPRRGTFADDTYHTIKLFYLERGGTDSNLSMRFNLAYVPETDGVKVDQFGRLLPGVEFGLYAAGKENGAYTVDTTKGTDGLLARGVTDQNGKFVLQDGEDATVSLNQLEQMGVKYLILRELTQREGYRPESDIYLTLESDNLTHSNSILLNDETNHWQTGTYVNCKTTVFTGPQLNIRLKDGSDGTADLTQGGTLFAVVMRRLTGVGDAEPSDRDEWGVVTGSALGGWSVRAKAVGSNVENVLSAVKGHPDNYYTFAISTNGSYMAEINHLPGDVRDYYFWLRDVEPERLQDTGYTVAYYYTTAESVEAATADNTCWVHSGTFERIYAGTIYVPNVKNYLYMEKLDEEGETVQGARFSIYRAADVTVTDPGTDAAAYTIAPGAEPLDTVETDEDGAARFPSQGKTLDVGDYYVVESFAPEGYRMNTTPVHVIVNELSVLADAGSENDGVETEVSLGTLVTTMAQFAIANDIDRTLTDVTSYRQTGTLMDDGTLLFTPNGEHVDLTVDPASSARDREGITYHPSDPDDADRPGWRVSAGWAWVKAQQNYDGTGGIVTGNPNEITTYNKQNLGDLDITRLFTGKVTVIMTDQRVGSLTVSKTVEQGENADELPEGALTADYVFDLILTDPAGEPFQGDVPAVKNGEDVTLTFTDGTARATLKHGESLIIPDLPAGTAWTAAEAPENTGRWETTVNGVPAVSASGAIENAGDRDRADFVNRYVYVTPPESVTMPGVKVTKTFTEDSDEYGGVSRFVMTGAPAPLGAAAEVTGAGSDSFGNVTFTSAGVYEYTVREIDGGVEGMEYDGTEYTVRVTVGLDGEENRLVIESVQYLKDGEEYACGDEGLIFRNRYTGGNTGGDTGALAVTKTVSGNDADPGDVFTFLVQVQGAEGEYGGVVFAGGMATVQLMAGQTVLIPGLPAGGAYTVAEAPSGYTVTSVGETGVIPADGTATASFNNHRDAYVPIIVPTPGANPTLETTDHYAYIIGYEDGTVRPEGNITRAEAATIFFRLLRDDVRGQYWTQVNPYSDVDGEDWFNNAVSTLAAMGIIDGYPDGTFRPNAPITRAEMAKIAVSFFTGTGGAGYAGQFSDVLGGEWFVGYLERALELGIVDGYPDGTFRPGRFITRGETCAMVNRTLGRKPAAGRLLPDGEMNCWTDNPAGAWYYADVQEATNSHDYVMGTDGLEDWTGRRPDRDWAALERSWSHAGSAPGGEVMD